MYIADLVSAACKPPLPDAGAVTGRQQLSCLFKKLLKRFKYICLPVPTRIMPSCRMDSTSWLAAIQLGWGCKHAWEPCSLRHSGRHLNKPCGTVRTIEELRAEDIQCAILKMHENT